jgi:hypothetical protein
MKIYKFILSDVNDQYSGGPYNNYDEALKVAEDVAATGTPVAIIELIYEYSDSSLVWTYNGSNNWPPKKRSAKEQKEIDRSAMKD